MISMEIDKFSTKLSLTYWQSLHSTNLKILKYLTTSYELMTISNPHTIYEPPKSGMVNFVENLSISILITKTLNGPFNPQIKADRPKFL
jgi:hypothetical protein